MIGNFRRGIFESKLRLFLRTVQGDKIYLGALDICYRHKFICLGKKSLAVPTNSICVFCILRIWSTCQKLIEFAVHKLHGVE